MTTPRTIQTDRNRAATRLTPASDAATATVRREYRERDFGVGYGRSSGYAGGKQYASTWTGAARFRCG